jgi:hypothetical protein
MAEVKQPRVTIIWKEEERLRVLVNYQKLERNDGFGEAKTSIEKWRLAQTVLEPTRRRPFKSQPDSTPLNKAYADYKAKGKLDVKVADHNHEPVHKRPLVPVEKPLETAPMAQLFAPSSAVSPPPVPAAAATTLDAVVRSMVREIMREEVLPVLRTLHADNKALLNDQFLRLMAYWDPEAAKVAQQEQVELPSQTGALAPDTPPPAPPKKKKVYLCGGLNDGFWTSIQKHLPGVELTFGDGRNQNSLPKGKEFDMVIAFWLTSHSAVSVIKSRYKDVFHFVAKGGQEAVVRLIKEKLAL